MSDVNVAGQPGLRTLKVVDLASALQEPAISHATFKFARAPFPPLSCEPLRCVTLNPDFSLVATSFLRFFDSPQRSINSFCTTTILARTLRTLSPRMASRAP
jgi:hypothetical protein